MSYDTNALTEPNLLNKLDDVATSIILAQSDKNPFTAFLSAAKKAAQKEFKWHGMLNANAPVYAFPDGLPQTAFGNEQPETMRSFCQEMREAWKVGRQAEATDTYTDQNDPVWQRKQALKRLYRQLERAISSRQEHRDALGTSADQGPRLRGAILALTPKLDTDPQTLYPWPDNLRTVEDAYYAGALDAFDDEALETMVTAISTASEGDVDLFGMVGISLAQRLANSVKKDISASGPFSVSIRRKGEQFDVNYVVDVFKFHAGTVRTMVTHHLACDLSTGLATAYTPRSGIFIPKDAFLLREVFPMEHEDVVTNGGGKAGFYRIMPGLQANMPRKCGLAYMSADASPTPPAEG